MPIVAKKKLQFDEIGYWSEIKIEILEKYARAYSSIISARESPRLKHYYIDAFAGAGEYVRKSTGEPVMGSPLAALNVHPPSCGYYFIELEPTKVGNLQSLIGSRPNVQIMEGDCNELLLEKVFPRVRYEDYRRAVCVLDPYGLHLDWKVIAKAGEMKSIEIFLNFPVADINRNVLWKNPDGVDPEDIDRMNTFWGDESWRQIAYSRSHQQGLFGGEEMEKSENDVIAEAFRQRLKDIAGFQNVPPPLPMRNTRNAIVYYLFFASRNNTAGQIVQDVFNSYRDRRG
jgi:three-Cys-motif partner protein